MYKEKTVSVNNMSHGLHASFLQHSDFYMEKTSQCVAYGIFDLLYDPLVIYMAS